MPSFPEGKEQSSEVTLMILHTAKGLEFPVVFVTGMAVAASSGLPVVTVGFGSMLEDPLHQE